MSPHMTNLRVDWLNSSWVRVLKQQKIEIIKVIAKIHENASQPRSSWETCLPELKKVLIGLLRVRHKVTRQLVSKLGEAHPMSRSWVQREDQLVVAAHSALSLFYDNQWNLWGEDYDGHETQAVGTTEDKQPSEP